MGVPWGARPAGDGMRAPSSATPRRKPWRSAYALAIVVWLSMGGVCLSSCWGTWSAVVVCLLVWILSYALLWLVVRQCEHPGRTP